MKGHVNYLQLLSKKIVEMSDKIGARLFGFSGIRFVFFNMMHGRQMKIDYDMSEVIWMYTKVRVV